MSENTQQDVIDTLKEVIELQSGVIGNREATIYNVIALLNTKEKFRTTGPTYVTTDDVWAALKYGQEENE